MQRRSSASVGRHCAIFPSTDCVGALMTAMFKRRTDECIFSRFICRSDDHLPVCSRRGLSCADRGGTFRDAHERGHEPFVDCALRRVWDAQRTTASIFVTFFALPIQMGASIVRKADTPLREHFLCQSKFSQNDLRDGRIFFVTRNSHVTKSMPVCTGFQSARHKIKVALSRCPEQQIARSIHYTVDLA